MVSYLGGLALSAFITHLTNLTRDAGFRATLVPYTADQTCLPGSSGAQGLPPCTACPIAKFSDSEYLNHVCKSCPPQTLTLPGATSVDECIPSCRPGFAAPYGFPVLNSVCTPCKRGEQAEGYGSHVCQPCPNEYYTLFIAARGL